MSAEQRAPLLEQFKTVTHVDSDEIAAQFLERAGWDVHVAIAGWYENPNLAPSNPRDIPTTHSRTNLPNREPFPNRHLQSPQSTAQRPSPGGDSDEEKDGLFSDLGALPGVAQMGYLIKGVGSICEWMFPSVGQAVRTAWTDEKVQNYSQVYNEFLEQFPQVRFFRNGTFRTVMQSAINARQCVFLYFHRHSDDDCRRFVQNVLHSPSVQQYLRANMVSWLGDLRHPEASHLFSQVSVQMPRARGGPFVVVCAVHPDTNRLMLLQRNFLRRGVSPEAFIGGFLDAGLQRWEAFHAQRAQEEQSRSASRIIREEQNLEYQRLVEEQQRREAEEANQAAERERREEELRNLQEVEYEMQRQEEERRHAVLRAIEERINDARKRLGPEPEITENNRRSIVRVRVRLPNGTQVQRRFVDSDMVRQIYFLVESQVSLVNSSGKRIAQWELMAYPRVKYNNPELTLREAGMIGAVSLFVQEVYAD